jgi:hypothetical protein
MAESIFEGKKLYEHIKVSSPEGRAVNTSPIFDLPVADQAEMTYDGLGNITGVTYKRGGNTVGTLAMTYTDGNLTSVVANNLERA